LHLFGFLETISHSEHHMSCLQKNIAGSFTKARSSKRLVETADDPKMLTHPNGKGHCLHNTRSRQGDIINKTSVTGNQQQFILRFRREIEGLELEVVDPKACAFRTTTSLIALDDLPNVEDTLKLLIGALQAVKPSGGDKVEVQWAKSTQHLRRSTRRCLSTT
jgi:hypothetical protein